MDHYQNNRPFPVRQVINESYMHNVPKGSETHFKVVVVSPEFNEVLQNILLIFFHILSTFLSTFLSTLLIFVHIFPTTHMNQGEAYCSSPSGKLLLGGRTSVWGACSFHTGNAYCYVCSSLRYNLLRFYIHALSIQLTHITIMQLFTLQCATIL